MFQDLLRDGQTALLVFARIMALFMVAPFFSSSAFPGYARVMLAFFTAAACYSLVDYALPGNGIEFVMMIFLELLLGVVMGMIMQIVFTVFQVAGQMFSVQMGFGASSTYDPLSQVEMPLVGQFFNLIAMYLFITIGGMRNLFIKGIYNSFQALTGAYILTHPDFLQLFFTGALGGIFQQAIVMAFPVIGTLLLVSLTTGLLAKAAPNMNLLMLGFPIQIGLGFLMLFMASPFIISKMAQVFDWGFDLIHRLLMYHFRGGVL
ncbi:MAG: flagellar biosynthetic protein FliR [Spirochaetales bacterium]|nr:flagellar biosynthetic protein FliR [Spirochaetales bacterium]